jgi:Tol biopolymer transport system component
MRRCLAKDHQRRLRDIGDARLEIEETLSGEAHGPVAAVGDGPARSGRGRLVWVGLATAVAAAMAAAAILVPSRESTSAPAAVRLSVLPARGTAFPNTGPWPAISPDGRYVVFASVATGGEPQLWLRQLEGNSSRPLSGTEGAIRPFWSPDSRAIGFFANGRISRVDIETGATRVLGDAPYTGGLAGTWGDDAIVFNLASGLYRISPSGGEPVVVVPRDKAAITNAPNFLPDGRRFLYVERTTQEGARRLCVASLDSEEKRCFEGIETPAVYASPGYLLFVRSGALLAQPFDVERLVVSGDPLRVQDARIVVGNVYEPPLFSTSRDGILVFHAGSSGSQLMWHDRGGARLGTPVGPGGRPALSPDGRLLAVQRRDPERETTDVWIHDLQAGTDTRFTFAPGSEGWPAFSPDGQIVMFSSAGSPGPVGLFRKRVRGDTPEEAVVPNMQTANPHWSSDGRFVIFQTPGKDSFDLLALRLDSPGSPGIPVAQTEHGEREGRFSPDVRWVAYDSTETGRREVWIQPFPPTGARWQISRTGGVSPQWRGDGKELFYVAGDGRLTAVAVEAESAIKAGSPKALFPTVFSGGVYANYVASHDGQRFLVSVPPALEDASPITVVVNWTALLVD